MADQGSVEDNFLTCYICYDVFNEPKTLPCLHRFCEKCLHNYILGLKSSLIIREKGFQCPVCREFIKSPNPQRPPSDWASLIKTDFHLKNLIRFVESRTDLSAPSIQGTTKAEHPCEVHQEQNRDLYCVDCTTAICHLCAGISHRGCNQVITLAEAADDRRATIDIELRDVFSKIKEAMSLEISRAKCLDQLERRKNEIAADIKRWKQEVIKCIDEEEQKLLEQLDNEYDSFQEKVSFKVITFDDKLFRLKEKLQSLSTRIKSASDFDLLEDVAVAETMDECRNEDININGYKRFLLNLSEVKIQFHKADVSSFHMGDVSVSNNGNEGQTSNIHRPPSVERVNVSQQLQRTSSGASVADSPQPSHNYRALPFASPRGQKPPPPPLPRKFSKIDLDKTSVMKNVVNEMKMQRETPESDEDDSTESSSESSAEYSTPVLLRTIRTRFREDTFSPMLRDLIVLTGSSTVMVTDWANQSVKAFYVRRERDNRLAVGGKPWAITQLSDSLVAVSLPLSKQICVIKITPSLMVQNSFMAAKKYSGLATLNSSTLVASGGSDPPSVDIINLYGEVLKSFISNESGEPLFVYPAYVSVTPSLLILVSDRKLGAVICISHTGDVKFTFRPEAPRRLHEPSGVISDSSGRVFVVEPRGLLALTPNGTFDKAVIRPQDGVLEDPRGVALDQEGLVYVTHQGEEIKVFKLQ